MVQIPSLTPEFVLSGKETKAPVAQLDRVADFESVGRTFESYRARHISTQNIFIGPLAQQVEQLTLNQ